MKPQLKRVKPDIRPRRFIDNTAAVAELKNALDVVETNAPINEREGKKGQSQLERRNAQGFRAAIRELEAKHGGGKISGKMTGKHCHENGTCHNHPDDGREYG